ncbi:uncharacterized protein BJ212DRAFT_1484496 [Suillus subaureus]|uniref:Uncharacterized protein n=1 Tax=Suillus subaureus TaxID=48587 RepID=A0A9P7E254_9AGAM|nr:uncharacterized protein BJ212DRAFT_1484496 [Suillus subaureus]KAG1809376.1 hypothetical protein BJ212DRAFT_1484496 [Suillus subaureus]
MDLIPYKPDPPSLPSPLSLHSPPDMPTPTSQANCAHPLQHNLLIFQDFKVTMSNANDDKTPSSGLTNSIHAPGNFTGDQPMSVPPSPTTRHIPTAEKQVSYPHIWISDPILISSQIQSTSYPPPTSCHCHIPQSRPMFHHIPTPSKPMSGPHFISNSFPDPLPLCAPHLSRINSALDLPLSSGSLDHHC